MKKLFVFVVMCLMLSTTQGQDVMQFVAEEIIKECNGTITQEDVINDTKVVIAELPSYYDEELVKISVSLIVRKYSDVNVLMTWRRTKDGGIEVVLEINSDVLLVSYTKNNQVLFIGWVN